jgi:hypothetical protein
MTTINTTLVWPCIWHTSPAVVRKRRGFHDDEYIFRSYLVGGLLRRNKKEHGKFQDPTCIWKNVNWWNWQNFSYKFKGTNTQFERRALGHIKLAMEARWYFTIQAYSYLQEIQANSSYVKCGNFSIWYHLIGRELKYEMSLLLLSYYILLVLSSNSGCFCYVFCCFLLPPTGSVGFYIYLTILYFTDSSDILPD